MINILGKNLCKSCFAEIASEPCPKCGFSEDSYIPEMTVLPCGSVLQGRYAIGRVIGKGGFGVTYLAYDIKLDRKIAIKEYFPRELAWRGSDTATVTIHNESDSQTFKNGAEKFYSEARLVAKFNGSPSIVNVFDFFYENSTAYYSMEYLQGQTIKDYISKNGTMTAKQVKYIAEEVASALITTHSANVLHRDVSPDNIMLCENGKIKLIDFGAARQVVSERSQGFSVILKPGFAPVEQYLKKGKQGPWTDIYSLGTTLYYCLTGKIPDDPMSRVDSDEDFISNLMSVDENLRNIILKAAALKIEDRYSSASEMLSDLRNGFTASSQTVEDQYYSAAVPEKENYSVEPPQYAAVPTAAETVPEVNVYGETAASNNKPLIIAAILGAIIVALLVFLIVSLLGGREDDTVTASAETQENYQTDELQTNDAETEQQSGKVQIGSDFYDVNMIGTLDLKGKGLKDGDIENLKYMTKVSEINLSNNQLTDLSPVSELKALQKLTFHNNNVSDISFVKNLGSLTVFGAGNNGISDISPLADRIGLKELWIFDNSIEDITPLADCKYLEYVDVSNNLITDLTPLTGKKLVTLKASNNKLNGNYDAIKGLSIFNELYLDGNGYDADPDGFYEFTGEISSDLGGFVYWI